MPPDPAVAQGGPSTGTNAAAVQRIATRLADPMATGTRAALRRMDPGTLSTPALQRLLAEAVPDGQPGADAAWALLVHCMALAAPDRHMGTKRLGVVLAECGFSEARLVRLLLPGADLQTTLPRTVRFIVARGGSVSGHDLRGLIRPALRAAPDFAESERARTRIARDYYRADRATADHTAEPHELETAP